MVAANTFKTTEAGAFKIDTDSLLVILGDTLINDNISNSISGGDFIGWHTVEDYKRWCLIKTYTDVQCDTYVKSFVDKPNEDPETRKAVIGIYYFTDIACLKDSIDKIINENITIKNEFQLSSAMEKYMLAGKLFKPVEFTQWFDCGDLETYTKTRKNISRCFNVITVTDENTIIKTSETQSAKIAKEAMWYLNIPNKLRVFTPQLIDYNLTKGKESYELEYVNFSPIHEFFIYEMPQKSDWEKILNNIFGMIGKFKQYSNKALYNVSAHSTEMFIEKTCERYQDMIKQPHLADMMEHDFFIINGEPHFGINKLLSIALEFIDKNVIESAKYNWQIIHGDLFFGNMLYDINSNTLKIVDPRGNFGVDGIYGDIRYDIAKLAHSIVGKYDFIVNGMYTVYSQSDTHIEYELYESKQKHDELVEMFYEMLDKHGFNKREIQVITGLLFFTLIPLHSENPTNQKIFYAIALQLLGAALA